MNKFILLFTTLTLLAGCAAGTTAQDEFPIEMQRTTAVFDSVNSKIWGEMWKPETPMTDFNLVQYKDILASLKSNRALELQDLLKSYEVQDLRGYANTFVFCIFSSELGVAMCDDARCSGVERKARSNTPEILEVWRKELPLLKCPQH